MVGPNPDRMNWHNLELNDSHEASIIRSLQSGAHIGVACARAGVTRTNFNGWMQRAEYPRQDRYTAFRDRVAATLGELETSFLERIVEAAADDWKAAAWFLERRFAKRWGKKDLPKTVVMTGEADRREDVSKLSPSEAAAYFRARVKMATSEAVKAELESHAHALELIQ